MPDELSNRLLHIGHCKMLTALLSEGDHYVTSLTDDSGMTYSHVHKSLQFYEEYGIVESQTVGRERRVSLTPYGQRVARQVKSLMDTLRESE